MALSALWLVPVIAQEDLPERCRATECKQVKKVTAGRPRKGHLTLSNVRFLNLMSILGSDYSTSVSKMRHLTASKVSQGGLGRV